jgi:GR25 family glycosyltransferase involved in LPS biosynthesis
MSFYINLDSREDRREQFEEECKKMNINVERFSAIKNEKGGIGCTESHLNVLKKARDLKLESVIIFEDDFQFLISREEYDQILSNLPDNYDVVMLSYGLKYSKPFNEMFGKVLEVQTASGYIVHSRFYEKLINRLEEGLRLFKLYPYIDPVYDKYINDQYWKPLQPVSNWYYSLKRVGAQRPSFSNLTNDYVDYGC